MGINLPMHHPPRPGQTATINPVDVALFGSSSFNPSVLIEGNNIGEGTSTTAWAVVANSGTGQVVLQLGTDTGALWSRGDVMFPSGSSVPIVHGQLRTEGSANESPGQVTVTPTIEGTVIDKQLTTISATFPVLSGSNFTINSGTQTISPGAITGIFVNGGTLTINPGSYGDLVVNGGTVTLLPGTYTFTNVTFNGGASAGTLQSNGVNAAIRVNVRFTLIFRGACTANTGGTNGYLTSNLRFAVFGSQATIGARVNPDTNVFRATVVAMNGTLIVEDSQRTYRGAFFGQSVTVHSNAVIQHFGFAAANWETPTG